MKTQKKNVKTKEQKPVFGKLAFVMLAATVVFFVLGIIDMSGVADFYPVNGLFALVGASLVLITVFYLLYRRFQKTVFKFMAVTVAVAAILEGTVFQFVSYETFLPKAESYSVTPSDAELAGDFTVGEDGSVSTEGKDQLSLTFKNLGNRVDTIAVGVEFEDGMKLINLGIDASDESHYTQRYGVGNAKITADESSQCVRMNLNGKVTDLTLRFTGTNENAGYTIRSLDFNVPKPFNIMFIRWAFIVLICGLVYCLFISKSLKNPFDVQVKKFTVAAAAALLAALIFMFGSIGYRLPEGGLAEDFEHPATNQISKEIVDAFEKGHVELDAKATEGFKNLSNPYDWSLRTLENESGEWDHVYYNGKYYSYYGVAPVFVLFLPYHAMTGNYFPTDIAVLIFSVVGTIFLMLTYLELIKRFFKKIPANMVLSGMVVMLASCGVFYLTGRTLFYEISISSGFMFTTLGAFLMLSSGVIEGGKLNRVKIAFSSLCFGLAVLSRPTLAVYAVCAAGFFIYRIVLGIKAKEKGWVLTAVTAGVPLFACAVFQMWYNMARFGSPFDFGITYSVTINDFTRNDFYLIFVFISLFAYLFNAPILSPTYPFVSSNLNKLGANGYYFNDVGTAAGIVYLATPVLGYLLGGKALKKIPEKKDRIKYALMVGVPCLLMPLIIICSVWESGYAIRYTADFTWEILTGALIILFFLYLKSENETKKKYLAKALAVCAVSAVLLNMFFVFNFTFDAEPSHSTNFAPDMAYMLERMLAFWV